MSRLIFCVLLSCFILAGLAAQESAPVFKLLEAEEYDIDVHYSTELQRLYFRVDFSVPAAELSGEAYYGLFLPKGMEFQSLTAAGKYLPRYQVKDLSAENFDPPLPQPELLAADYPAELSVFLPRGLPSGEDEIPIRLWYNMPVPAFTVAPDHSLGAEISARQFWYPRNISRQSKVNVVMTSPPYISLLIGNNFASHSDGDYIRTHRSSYLETADQPCSLFLLRD